MITVMFVLLNVHFLIRIAFDFVLEFVIRRPLLARGSKAARLGSVCFSAVIGPEVDVQRSALDPKLHRLPVSFAFFLDLAH